MPLVCPFLSGQNPINGSLILEDCIESQCQVWDNINLRCGAKTSDVSAHIHNSHYHPSGHSCASSKYGLEYLNGCGGDAHAQLITRAAILIQEFLDKFYTGDDGDLCVICGKKTKFLNINIGYEVFCSKECKEKGRFTKYF